MKTATFNVAMADESFPGGMPAPTALRARAEAGPAVKSPVSAPWSATHDSSVISMVFDEATEAGAYDGFVDLMVGVVAVKTIGPVAFLIPAGPTTVTYRSPIGFTVTVG